MSDWWKAYNCLAKEGFFHQTVNHSKKVSATRSAIAPPEAVLSDVGKHQLGSDDDVRKVFGTAFQQVSKPVNSTVAAIRRMDKYLAEEYLSRKDDPLPSFGYAHNADADAQIGANASDSAVGKSTICDWYSNFKRGRTSTEDSKRSGRPKEVIIPEIIRQVRQIVLTDRRVKVREIAETVGMSTGSAVSILHDHLHMKKLNVKWVLHFLDIEQREKRVADSKSCLDMFNRNPSEFLRRYITMDETWIQHYISESHRSSAEWREAGESRSKRVKASRWAAEENLRLGPQVESLKQAPMNAEFGNLMEAA
ncbi:hypothetical protein ACLKA7_001392 [Drosophila subpalustris]